MAELRLHANKLNQGFCHLIEVKNSLSYCSLPCYLGTIDSQTHKPSWYSRTLVMRYIEKSCGTGLDVRLKGQEQETLFGEKTKRE